MKIALVANTAWNIHHFRLKLVTSFLDEGHEVIAISPEDDYVKYLEELNVKHLEVKMNNKGINPIQEIVLAKAFYNIYKKEKPDVILHFTIKPNIYGSLAAGKLGIPVINNVSGLGTAFIRQNLITKIVKKLYKRAFKKAQLVFFQNNEDKDLFFRYNLVTKEQAGLLPGSGVNVEKYIPSEYAKNKEFKFLVIARTLVDKGLYEYFNAAQLLIDKGITAKFQLIGFRDHTKVGVKEKDFQRWLKMPWFEYLGSKEDVRSCIQSSNCVVLPSYREGTPRSLLEAAAMGKPIITTEAPGCKETVIPNKNGYLCKVKDEKDLAVKMFAMYRLSQEELQNMGAAGRQLVEQRFDEKIVLEKYLNAINQVI